MSPVKYNQLVALKGIRDLVMGALNVWVGATA